MDKALRLAQLIDVAIRVEARAEELREINWPCESIDGDLIDGLILKFSKLLEKEVGNDHGA